MVWECNTNEVTRKDMHISIDKLSKKYPFTKALEEVSLEIEPGQIISVLGPNGAGKTTLLRCLAGMVFPEQGQIRYDGVPFTRDNLDQRRRLHFMPDFPILFYNRSVLRNISVMLRAYGREQEGIEDKVANLLQEFDLLPVCRVPMNSLSRGQSYKGTLAGMLAADPELWLVDEPFASGMDPHGINAFRNHARQAAKCGRTIIYTTQMLEIAEQFSDRVCVIDEGALIAFDTLPGLRKRCGTDDRVLERLFRDLRDAKPGNAV